jgi:hypothetical protein
VAAVKELDGTEQMEGEQQTGPVKVSNNIQVNLPPELKTLVATTSAEQDQSVSGWVAKLIARELGYDLPIGVTRTRTRKYATEEERKEAQAARQREKNGAVNALIEAAQRGEIANLDPQVKALLGIK